MAEPDPNRSRSVADKMIREVGARQTRMLKARTAKDSFWSSLGVLGVVGWSVVLPTLLGIALGVFLDRRWPGQMSWTLALLFGGLVLGCINAWIHLRGNHK